MANGVDKRSLVRKIDRTAVSVSAGDVKDAWARSPASALTCICLDRDFYAYPPEVWETVLLYSALDSKEYEESVFDCDDFAFAFKGVMGQKLRIGSSIGVVIDYSGGHAYNAVLACPSDTEVKILFLEPQTDRYVLRGMSKSDDESYAMRNGYVLF